MKLKNIVSLSLIIIGILGFAWAGFGLYKLFTLSSIKGGTHHFIYGIDLLSLSIVLTSFLDKKGMFTKIIQLIGFLGLMTLSIQFLSNPSSLKFSYFALFSLMIFLGWIDQLISTKNPKSYFRIGVAITFLLSIIGVVFNISTSLFWTVLILLILSYLVVGIVFNFKKGNSN